MKLIRSITLRKPATLVMTVAIAMFASAVYADNTNTVANVKPDLLKTCPVSGEKLGGDMGKPFVFVYQGQEVKLCCSMCQADFKKDPAKFIAKIRAADKPDKK